MDMKRIRSRAPSQDLVRGGEMRERVRNLDWSATPLGPQHRWNHDLRLAVGICLDSGFPIALYLGPQFTLIYNDAWIPVPGDRHPWALGQTAQAVWPEIWNVIGPNFEHVMSTGEAIFAKDAPYFMQRHGYTEECYFDYTLGPIRGSDDAIIGIFNAAIETTYRVLGERRTRLLRELAEHVASARSADEACILAAETLASAAADLPFALLYLEDADGSQARLAAAAGMARDTPASPAAIPLGAPDAGPWPCDEVVRTGKPRLVSDVARRFGPLPGGPWPESPELALVLPIPATGPGRPAGFLIAGVSPRRKLDDNYRAFFELAAGHVATAVANARAYQMERERAEALADLDRAKTAFFSNVSHEFRTPLTLILGPLEDLLAQPLPPEIQGSLTVAHRNSLRLMRLVNTLLEFSRIEAGRVRAHYEPADLAAVTTDLASAFRSACEQAGLHFRVDCPALPEPVYVDRDMWEKVVLNLISNAFKFTFEGEIEVKLRSAEGHCELSVRDTGVGIPETELGRVFERFHRVEATRARSFEGTGIGLALVEELVRLHGGSIRVESILGQGSTFFVALPFGSAHLPAEHIEAAPHPPPARRQPVSYVEEARQWLVPEERSEARSPAPLPIPEPGASPDQAQQPGSASERPRVLLADDNADMRDYVRHLLAPHYLVETVADGQAALAAARRRPPALVLADVMMPRLDGFGLVQALRADPQFTSMPVVLLSARAGEESRVEGLEAGADDYLVKPFSARELLARVRTHIELGRLRQELARAAERQRAEARLRRLVEANIIGILFWDLAGNITEANNAFLAMLGYSRQDLLSGRIRWTEITPPEYRVADEKAIAEIRSTGTCTPYEKEFLRQDGRRVPVLVAGAAFEESTEQGIAFALDLSEHRRAEAERQAREAAEAASRSKSEFLANMSHELRSPLNTILGFARLMARDPALPETTRDDLDQILKSGEHLHELINDVLDLSKLEAGRATFNATDFDLDFMLDELRDMLTPAAVHKGLHLVFAPRVQTPYQIRTDPLKLRQILINLIGNGLKFSQQGGVTLGVEVIPDPEPALTRLRFTVTDTGPGIAPDELPHLFNPFVQAQAGRQAREGTGLGLAISRRFVQLMGGEMGIASQLGQGTTIWFELPVQRVEAAVQTESMAPRRVVGLAPGQPRYRLLVVDDHAEARQLLIRLLEPLGFDLKEAGNGQEAIDAWRQWHPHLIWMDMRMPVLEGRDAARRIRSAAPAGQAYRTVIIALTASSFEEERCDLLASGCDDLLRKPFRETDLFAMMEKHLGVRFVYEVAAAALPPSVDIRALVGLPKVLRGRLEKALARLDAAAVDQVIEAIRKSDPQLADGLAGLAGNFQYDRILALMQLGE